MADASEKKIVAALEREIAAMRINIQPPEPEDPFEGMATEDLHAMAEDAGLKPADGANRDDLVAALTAKARAKKKAA